MKNIVLDNGILRAEFCPTGAELVSLRCDGIERIWEGDKAVWGRHSPNLFPIIGRLMNDEYSLGKAVVKGPRHGFCRDRAFDTVTATDTLVCFATEDDEATRRVYPFSFRLEIEYELQDDTLVKRIRVTNLSIHAMPFEFGGHDGYAIPLREGETVEDYGIAFEETDEIHPYGMDESGMVTLPKSVCPLNNGMLEKWPWDLNLDTIILDDLPVRQATLLSKKSGLGVEVRFDDFGYLGIWTTKTDNPRYLCIEPWTTMPDGYFMSRDLFERPGIQVLQPGESRTLCYTERFF